MPPDKSPERTRRQAQPLGAIRSQTPTVVVVGLFALILCACAPGEFTYTHPVLEGVDGLRSLELSRSSPDTQGKELLSPIVGLPIRSELRRPSYVIEFHTPLQARPLMFMAATSSAGEQLEIVGPNIHRVAPGSAEELEGHFYSFYFHETNSSFVSLTIKDARGNILGSEKIRYSVVPRGHEITSTFES